MGIARAGIGAQAAAHLKSRKIVKHPVDKGPDAAFDQLVGPGRGQLFEDELCVAVIEPVETGYLRICCEDGDALHRSIPSLNEANP